VICGKYVLYVEPFGLFTYSLFQTFKQWSAIRGLIWEGFREECTIFWWAGMSVCGMEDDANFARVSAISFPEIPLCPGTHMKTTS